MVADRTSTATMRANRLRPWFSSIARVLMNEMRRVALRGTELASASLVGRRSRRCARLTADLQSALAVRSPVTVGRGHRYRPPPQAAQAPGGPTWTS
ncbi:MAG: transposase [Deltaproteobacteria bacterium]|nr:transposase [Deltaproteobacteria bacterium]